MAAEVERGVVPAHPVEQVGQFLGGAAGHEEEQPPVGAASTGPTWVPIRSSRTRARSPAGSGTSSTSKPRPAGSSTLACGSPSQSARASCALAPAGSSRTGTPCGGCSPGAAQCGRPQAQPPPSRGRALDPVRTGEPPRATVQPQRPAYSAAAMYAVARVRRREPNLRSPNRLSMPPPTEFGCRRLRDCDVPSNSRVRRVFSLDGARRAARAVECFRRWGCPGAGPATSEAPVAGSRIHSGVANGGVSRRSIPRTAHGRLRSARGPGQWVRGRDK